MTHLHRCCQSSFVPHCLDSYWSRWFALPGLTVIGDNLCLLNSEVHNQLNVVATHCPFHQSLYANLRCSPTTAESTFVVLDHYLIISKSINWRFEKKLGILWVVFHCLVGFETYRIVSGYEPVNSWVVSIWKVKLQLLWLSPVQWTKFLVDGSLVFLWHWPPKV